MLPQIVAGETFNYRSSYSDYPATDGWALTLYLNPRAGGALQSITSTPDGDDHLLQASATTTAGWAAGSYAWEIWAARAGERYRIAAGQAEISASLLSAPAGTDTRSAAEIALDNVNAMLAGRASDGVQAYSIAGRQLSRYSMAELLRLRATLQAQVGAEMKAKGLATSFNSVRKVLVRIP